MLTATEKQELRKKLAKYEGTVFHMYLDSKGYVTVGVGHLINTVADAQKLSFIDEKTKKKATADEIKTDFETISKQQKNKLASFYKPHTKLVLEQTDIDGLTNEHIDNFYKELKKIYSDFDDYPEEARLALFDMIFNLGMTNLKTSWTNFNDAIKSKDWQKAADNSSRKSPVSAERNMYVKDLLEKAAKNADKSESSK